MASKIQELGHAAERQAIGVVIDGLVRDVKKSSDKRKTYLKFMDLAEKFFGKSCAKIVNSRCRIFAFRISKIAEKNDCAFAFCIGDNARSCKSCFSK